MTSDIEKYGYSRLTDTWYRVTEWEDLGGGKIKAKSKKEVPREDVPQEWIEATKERSIAPDSDREAER
jgi:hypothetical protein